MILSVQTVHTSGVNWESLGVIISALVFVFGLVTWRQAQSDRKNERTKNEITVSVDNLRDVLLEKLETKENVNQIRVDMAGLKADVENMRTELRYQTRATT
jgi:hypothetical protein